MNYPMFVLIPIPFGHIWLNVDSYEDASEKVKDTLETFSGNCPISLDIRCQKTCGYMGRVDTIGLKAYNAADQVVYEPGHGSTENTLSNIEIKPTNY